MKIAILSDIHANLTALKAVLADCYAKYQDNINFINLGDCIDYGMNPNEVVSELINLKDRLILNIKGNHERAILGFEFDRFSSQRGKEANQYTNSILNKQSFDFIKHMKDCPFEIILCDKKILCVHGDLTDLYWGKMNDDEIKKEDYLKYDFILSGHTHISSFRTIIQNKEKKVNFINSGSVGQPRNLNPNAQYCVLDLDASAVSFNSVAYNIVLEQKKYNGKIDEYYRDRLSKGI